MFSRPLTSIWPAEISVCVCAEPAGQTLQAPCAAAAHQAPFRFGRAHLPSTLCHPDDEYSRFDTHIFSMALLINFESTLRCVHGAAFRMPSSPTRQRTFAVPTLQSLA